MLELVREEFIELRERRHAIYLALSRAAQRADASAWFALAAEYQEVKTQIRELHERERRR